MMEIRPYTPIAMALMLLKGAAVRGLVAQPVLANARLKAMCSDRSIAVIVRCEHKIATGRWYAFAESQPTGDGARLATVAQRWNSGDVVWTSVIFAYAS